jgi:hypothetical protein
VGKKVKIITAAVALAALTVSVLLASTGCGNRDAVDFQYTFDAALVKFPDGSYKELGIKSWRDYDGEQIQIKTHDGSVYVVSSMNCILLKKGEPQQND